MITIQYFNKHKFYSYKSLDSKSESQMKITNILLILMITTICQAYLVNLVRSRLKLFYNKLEIALTSSLRRQFHPINLLETVTATSHYLRKTCIYCKRVKRNTDVKINKPVKNYVNWVAWTLTLHESTA